MIGCIVELLLSKWTLLLGIFGYFAYKWSTATFDTFEKRGLKFIPPTPLFGSFKNMAFQKESFKTFIQKVYSHFPNDKVIGYYEMRNPTLVIRDPDTIKQLCVKDFEHFLDRRVAIDEKDEPIFGRVLASIKGQRWRDMRSTLSPAFTGSKMRTMFQLVSECAESTIKYLETESQGKTLTTDMKDFFTRFTNDVIGTCAFGIKVDSFKDKENEFYMAGKEATNFGGFTGFVIFLLFHFPKLKRALGLTIISNKITALFRSLVWDTIRHRERENIVRPDMINLLIQARKGKLQHETNDKDTAGFATVEETKVGEAIHQSKLEEDDLTAQCFIFFVAGFDTTSTCMSFTAHELAANPDVQKKLLAEVDETYAKLGGKPLTYEALQAMPYLDMVVSEGLRYWPPAMAADRMCVKPYKMEIDGKPYEVKEGEGLIVPIVALHHDPKYFPNPSKFEPERFSPENQHNIVPFSYLPFGVGPRNCIGSRFALMEVKAILYYILTKFTFEVSIRTRVPLELEKAGFQVKPVDGWWVDLKPRKSS